MLGNVRPEVRWSILISLETRLCRDGKVSWFGPGQKDFLPKSENIKVPLGNDNFSWQKMFSYSKFLLNAAYFSDFLLRLKTLLHYLPAYTIIYH